MTPERGQCGFTPGSWQVFDHYCGRDPEFAGEEYAATRLIGTGQFDTIAEVRMGHDDIGGNLDANAAVMAAAPDLYEALKACRDQFDFYASEHRAAGKHEKAATNEKFAFLATQALAKAAPDLNALPLARGEYADCRSPIPLGARSVATEDQCRADQGAYAVQGRGT